MTNKIEKYTQVIAIGLFAIAIVGCCICRIVSLFQPHEVVQKIFKYLVMVPFGTLGIVGVFMLLYGLIGLIIYLINEEE